MMKSTHFTWLLAVFLVSCQTKPISTEKVLPFLEGEWVMNRIASDSRSFVETWSKENDSTFTGIGYIFNSETGDHFNSEELYLNYRDGSWVYSAQPNNAPLTDFSATDISQTVLLFENLSHDFPQFIKYELISPDSLLVTIGDSTSFKKWKMVKRD